MIRRWIQQLQHKPKPVRDRVAISIAGSVTAFVFLAWLYVTPGKIGEVATEVREQPGTFSLFFDKVREQTASVVDGVNRFNEDASESNSEAETPSLDTINTETLPNTTYATTSPSTVSPSNSNARAIRLATTTASSTE